MSSPTESCVPVSSSRHGSRNRALRVGVLLMVAYLVSGSVGRVFSQHCPRWGPSPALSWTHFESGSPPAATPDLPALGEEVYFYY